MKEKVAQATEYLILRFEEVPIGTGDSFAGWVEVSDVKTIRDAVEKRGAGRYVQVPKRSWKPESYKLEPKLVKGNKA